MGALAFIIIHIHIFIKNDFLSAKKTNDRARVKIVFIEKGNRHWSKNEKKGGRRL
jgi:hypothetical protein